jgi:hypothetical protein
LRGRRIAWFLTPMGWSPCFRPSVRQRIPASIGDSPYRRRRPVHYDLDAIRAWSESDSQVVDCDQVLTAWNLFGDLPHEGNLFAGADRRANQIYEKLFLGCNLPAITPAGEHYVPTWSVSEIVDLKHLVRLGIAEFRARLRR